MIITRITVFGYRMEDGLAYDEEWGMKIEDWEMKNDEEW